MKLFSLAILIYGGVFAALYLAQGKLIYPFDPTRVLPKEAGEPRLTEKTLLTQDGEMLVIWTASAKAQKPTLLYFHGNAGNLAMRVQRFDRLLDRGYGVVALGYRGSSGSTGSPSEVALIADAVQLREELADLLGRPPRGKIIYYGESLGTGVAVALAGIIPPDALMLEAPFTSIATLAARSLPIYPVRHFVRDKWNTLTRIRGIRVPLFVIHGTADSVVPFADGLQVFGAAGTAIKDMKTMSGEDHFQLWSLEGQTAIYGFIEGL
ncbi:MAG: alpha/beta hydrolase [Rhodobacteraceae bacterium]|nr:alpha/beta hydrolase [Paracoccaceae bacterium]